MRSKTSCFNAPFFGRTLLRLWPLWAIACAVFFFLLPAPLWQELSNGYSVWTEAGRAVYLAQDILYSTVSQVLPVVMAVLGCAAGLFTWRWLYSARSANCYFSLPLRREGLFLTHFAAGLAATLIPVLFAAACTLIVELCFDALDARSLLVLLGTGAAAGLLFFSLATLCAMVTGHTVAMPAFFVIANFLVAGAYMLVTYLLHLFVFGMGSLTTPAIVDWFTPLPQLLTGCPSITREAALGSGYLAYSSGIEHLWYYGVYAGAGAVLAVVSLLLLRRRPAESAGDLIAFRPLRPVFQIGLSVCFGLAMTVFIETMYLGVHERSFALTLALVLAWSFVGFFGAEMLLRKSFRVFRARALTTWAVLAAVLVAIFSAVGLDAFGYESRIPDESDVSSVELYTLGTADTVDYATAFALHRAILDARDTDATRFNVFLTYHLKNGRTVSREYEIDADSEAYRLARAWAIRPESLEKAAFGSMESDDQLLYMTVYDFLSDYDSEFELDEQSGQMEAVLAALRADFAEGRSAIDFEWGDDHTADLRYQITLSYFTRPYDSAVWTSRADYAANCPTAWSYIYVTSEMTHTYALLDALAEQAREG